MEAILNSNVSFFVAFISSLWGFSYPMLLQVVSTVDSKYQSTHILALLKESSSYVAYKYSLIVNYILLASYFGVKYYIYLCNPTSCLDQLIIALLFITLSASLGILLWLFKDVNTFLSANSLEGYFINSFDKEKDNLSKDILLAWSDYIMFVINGGYIEKSGDMLELYEKYVIYLRESNVEYPKELHDVTIAINRAICSSQDDFSFTSFDASRILSSFYGCDDKFNSDDVFKTLWLGLLQQIYYNKDKAIFKYWKVANQRNGFYFSNFSYNEIKIKEYVVKEKEFHLMLCVNLFYNQKVDLLRDILFYSNTTPPKYNLVPNSFSDIFEWVLKLNEGQFLDGYKFESKYVLLGIKNVFSDELRNNAIRFLALLCCRLKYLMEFLRSDDVFLIPNIKAETPVEIKKYEDALAKLKDKLNEIKELRLEDIYFDNIEIDNDKLEKTIEKFENKIQSAKEWIEKNQPLSDEIINRYEKRIKSIIEKNIEYYDRFITLKEIDLPSVENFDDDRCLLKKQITVIERKQDDILEANYFKEGQLYSNVNLAETIAERFCYSINNKISICLLTANPLKINFKSLDRLFNNLNLDNNKYLILASVDNDWQLAKISKFKEYDVMRINGQPFFNRIVFVNKKAMPKIYMNEPKCETQELFNLKKAGDNYPLYLGLVPLNQESELLRELKAKEDKDYSNNVYLSIFCSLYLYMPNNWVQLSLEIDDSILDEDVNWEELKSKLS